MVDVMLFGTMLFAGGGVMVFMELDPIVPICIWLVLLIIFVAMLPEVGGFMLFTEA